MRFFTHRRKMNKIGLVLVACALFIVGCGPDLEQDLEQEREPFVSSPKAPDSDGDGIPDVMDLCGETPEGAVVWTYGDWIGCGEGQVRDEDLIDPTDPDPTDPDPTDPDPTDPDPTDPDPTDPPAHDTPPVDDPEPEPDPEPDPTCTYPAAGQLRAVGDVLPAFEWSSAFDESGNPVSLNMTDFYCDPEFDRYNAVVFILVAEWCGNCGTYLSYIANEFADIDANGGLVVLIDLETRSYTYPDSSQALSYFSGKVGNAPATRVGEGSLDPAGAIYQSPIWSVVPNGFVVRRRDMQVIVSQQGKSHILPYVDIVGDVERDWSYL